MKFSNITKLLLAITCIGCLTSCTAVIDPSAANSASGIIVSLGEIFLAGFTFFIVVIVRGLRVCGLLTALLALSAFMGVFELTFPPIYLLLLGIVMFAISFMNIKPHKAQTFITDKPEVVEAAMKPEREPSSIWSDIILPMLVGIVLLIVEYTFFVK